MGSYQPCSDVHDAISLYHPLNLYLKPVAAFHISVQLPQLKALGKAISNGEIMEKLRYWIKPDVFTSLKVSKNTLEFIRFDAEIESRSELMSVLLRLDKRTIKISGFKEQLKVRATEAKPEFPSRHDWDKFFRDAKHMDEMKPGERPDTMYISNLPCEWFANFGHDKPDGRTFRKIFEQFGEVRYVDIPILDSFRSQMDVQLSGIKIFPSDSNMFEAYVQFKEYYAFTKAMDTFRGMKLLYMDDGQKAYTVSLKVDFDKTKHLSEENIRRRKMIRERLIAKEAEKKELERKKIEQERELKEREMMCKMERRKLREQIRKEKHLKILQQKEAEELNKKIASEERLLLIAQRKLESIRLVSELLSRVKNDKLKELNAQKSGKSGSRKGRDLAKGTSKEEDTVRNRLIQRFKKRAVEKEERRLAKALKRSDPLRHAAGEDVTEENQFVYEDPVDADINVENFGRNYSENFSDSERKFYRSNHGYGTRGRRPWRNFRGGRYGGWEDRDYAGSIGWTDRDFGGRGRRNFRGRGSYRGQYGRWWHRENQDVEDFGYDAEEDDYLAYPHDYHKYYQSISGEGRRDESYSSRSWSYTSDRSYSRSRSKSRSRGKRKRSESVSRSRSRSRPKKSKTPNKESEKGKKEKLKKGKIKEKKTDKKESVGE